MFGSKVDGVRVQGVLTRAGWDAFERMRGDCARFFERVTGRSFEHPSDAEVIEFMALGARASRERLTQRQSEEEST